MSAVAGIYRGVCVDGADPEKLGRIRVQVPQLLGSSASGWALPAWSLHDLTIWPEDRLPKPGQGVWVMFEGPDRLTWISVFGPQEFSQQLLDEDPINYATITSLFLPALLDGLESLIIGTVLAPAGAPEGGEVYLDRGPSATGPWEDAGGPASISRIGDWSIPYTYDAQHEGWWFRARFTGIDPYQSSDSDAEQQADLPLETELLLGTPVSPDAVAWKQSTTFGGWLLYDNRGLSGRTLVLLVRTWDTVGGNNGPWRVVGTSAPTGEDGSWSISWVRGADDDASPIELVVYFPGSYPYRNSFAPSLTDGTQDPWQLPPPSLTASIALDAAVPPFIKGDRLVLTGTATSAYGAPGPNPVIRLEVRSPSSLESPSSQTTRSFPTTISESGGTLYWTADWTADTSSADIRVVLDPVWVYTEASTAWAQNLATRSAAPTAPNLPATIVVGSPFTATGFVVDQYGEILRGGTVYLQVRPVAGGSWADAATSTIASGGTCTFTQVTVSAPDSLEWRFRVAASATTGISESVGPSIARSAVLGQPTLVKGTVTVNSASLSWNAISSAVQYEVRRNGTLVETISATSHTSTALSTMTDYTFTVTALDALGTPGLASAPITCNTGRSAVVLKGSFTNHRELTTKTGTYRTDYGRWVQDGDYAGADYRDTLTGYYSDSAALNVGVVNYNGAGFRDWVVQNYGAEVRDALKNGGGGVWTGWRIWMNRSTSSYTGDGGARRTYLYVTNAVPQSSGNPLRAGGADMGLFTRGVGRWYTAPSNHAHWARHVLMNETNVNNIAPNPVRGWAIRYDNQTHYMRFEAAAADPSLWALEVSCSWDFTSVAAVTPVWY